MSESAKDRKHLSDQKINDIIMSNFSALRRCIQKELDNNPSFSGVTVKFYVRPNGSTGGVTLKEKQYLDRPVGRCLTQEFQQMDFPAHSAIDNKGVTFPLRINR
ncbi:MAG: AgmX/PglI C-terminal domain-containing protein [Bradymonadaceae bacterium]